MSNSVGLLMLIILGLMQGVLAVGVQAAALSGLILGLAYTLGREVGKNENND